MLDVIFSEKLSVQEKLEVLDGEFGISPESVKEEMKVMCNISEYYYEQGISQGKLNATIQMGKDYGIPKAEIIDRIIRQFSFTWEEAVEKVEKMW